MATTPPSGDSNYRRKKYGQWNGRLANSVCPANRKSRTDYAINRFTILTGRHCWRTMLHRLYFRDTPNPA